MGSQYGSSVLLLYFTLASTNTFAAQVQLQGQRFIHYSRIGKDTDPRQTEIKLRFRTIHPNGLLIYGTDGTGTGDYLQLDIHHGQVR